jgi:hypothetical protein
MVPKGAVILGLESVQGRDMMNKNKMWFSSSGNAVIDLAQVAAVVHIRGNQGWDVELLHKVGSVSLTEMDGEELVRALGGLS